MIPKSEGSKKNGHMEKSRKESFSVMFERLDRNIFKNLKTSHVEEKWNFIVKMEDPWAPPQEFWFSKSEVQWKHRFSNHYQIVLRQWSMGQTEKHCTICSMLHSRFTPWSRNSPGKNVLEGIQVSTSFSTLGSLKETSNPEILLCLLCKSANFQALYSE